eukprot:216203_1
MQHQMLDTWEQKFNHLQIEHDILKQNYAQLEAKTGSQYSKPHHEHTGEFWTDVEHKISTDPDYVKGLVRNKVLTVFDRNPFGQTLLMLASYTGSYEITRFCINHGADLKAKSSWNQTALDLCRQSGYCHVEQLLLFSAMNVSIGNDIKNTANTIHKQDGINDNILNELSLIGAQSKNLFEKILMEIMINIINKRLSFSDTLMHLCWSIASRQMDPLKSDLWKALSSTCSDIIQNGGKRDWYFLKKCVISSTLWYKSINNRYLYYELLNLVNAEADRQLRKLDTDLNELANANREDWNQLTTWDLPDDYDVVRQDLIPNGIVSRYTYNQLSESSGSTFNSPRFYDYNQYLSQLVLLSQIVDDEFQRSVQKMFNIDKVTRLGSIHTDDHDDEKLTGDGEILYLRGPVKLIERARYKAHMEYSNLAYPSSACVVDLNRCSLIFNDISTMLSALRLFVNKVKYYRSGNIIGVVRDKNGFVEYVKKTQYADIKLNVLIKGKHNNIIGEVQFLLKTMKRFKDKAHNLYSIQRQEESIESSSRILPLLLDENKQLYGAGSSGNVKQLCELMVMKNKSVDDLMKVDDKLGNTILHKICIFGHDQAFAFVRSLLSTQEFVKHVLLANVWNQRPVEYSFRYSRLSTCKSLFDMQEIRAFYKSKNELFRLCYHLFVKNRNNDLTDYIMTLLSISADQVKEMMSYQYDEPQRDFLFKGAILYDEQQIISRTVRDNTFGALQKLKSIVGETMFVEHILRDDKLQINALEYGIERDKMKSVQHMVSFKEIKQEYAQNKNLMYRLLYWLFASSGKAHMIKFVLSELNITSDTIQELICYRHPVPSQHVSNNCMKYHFYSVIACVVNKNTLSSLKHLVDIIGEKVFYDGVFVEDGWNQNAVENALKRNKIEMLQYLLSFKEIKARYLNDDALLFRLMYWLFAESVAKKKIIDFVLSELAISSDKMRTLITYKYEAVPVKRSVLKDERARMYERYSIVARVVLRNNLETLKYLAGIIRDDALCEGVFLDDESNGNALLCAMKKNKLDVMKYLLSKTEIRTKCVEDKDELNKIRASLTNNELQDEAIAMYVAKTLNIS